MRAIRAVSVFVFRGHAGRRLVRSDLRELRGESSAIWALPWGKVTVVDLYAGLVLFGAWIAWREGSKGVVLAWWVALAVLGNLAAAGYLLRATLIVGSVPELLTRRK